MLEIVARVGERNVYLRATHVRAELDPLVTLGDKRCGFKFKWSDTPVPTRSMHIAMADLVLDHLTVIHPDLESHPLSPP